MQQQLDFGEEEALDGIPGAAAFGSVAAEGGSPPAWLRAPGSEGPALPGSAGMGVAFDEPDGAYSPGVGSPGSNDGGQEWLAGAAPNPDLFAAAGGAGSPAARHPTPQMRPRQQQVAGAGRANGDMMLVGLATAALAWAGVAVSSPRECIRSRPLSQRWSLHP